MAEMKNPISQPYFGGAPYGDAMEVSGPPVFEFIPDLENPFLKTDARAIMILMYPHHYNFIPNPAFREDATGWAIQGASQGSAVLDTAIWSVDAAKAGPTADWLEDLSGNGRDLVFGTSAFKPRLLTHTGEDYAFFYNGSVHYDSTASPPNWNTDVDVTIDFDWEGTVLGRTPTLYSTDNDWAFSIVVSGSDGKIRLDRPGAGHIINRVVTAGRHTIRVLATATNFSVWLDNEATPFTGTWTFTKSTGTYVFIGNGAYNLKVYSAHVKLDGVEQFTFDPATHDPAAMTFTNAGSKGGTWIFTRTSAGGTGGGHTAVVDRSMVMFGEKQNMDALMPSVTNGTILMLCRVWNSPNFSRLWLGSNLVADASTKGIYAITGKTNTLVTNTCYVGTDAGTKSDIPNSNFGEHVFGAMLGPNGFQGIRDGNIVSTDSSVTSGAVFIHDRLRVGSITSATSFEFLSAAIWDHPLTASEIMEAYTSMVNGITQGAEGGSDSIVLDESDMWVGKSVAVNGDAVLRYRDTDSLGNPAYVYVGAEQDIDDPEWKYDPSKGSAEWTFSVFVKGTARVRLVMDAYRQSEYNVPKSAPELQNLTVVADPANEPYNASIPAVKDANGDVWRLRLGPFYESLGRPSIEANPASITTQTDQYLMDGSGKLWQAKVPAPATAPLYTNMGTPTVIVDNPAITTDDPENMEPAQQYLIVESTDPGRDGFLWSLMAGPYYEPMNRPPNFGQVMGDWVDVRTDDWTRLYIQTSSGWEIDEESGAGTEGDLEGGGRGGNFFLVDWIDARIEIEDAEDLLVSAVMLDPTEWPIASYFDGSMTEDPQLDDFMWAGTPNDSISYYYLDRIARSRWLAENLKYLVPVNRTFALFFASYGTPFVGPTTLMTSSQRSFTI